MNLLSNSTGRIAGRKVFPCLPFEDKCSFILRLKSDVVLVLKSSLLSSVLGILISPAISGSLLSNEKDVGITTRWLLGRKRAGEEAGFGLIGFDLCTSKKRLIGENDKSEPLLSRLSVWPLCESPIRLLFCRMKSSFSLLGRLLPTSLGSRNITIGFLKRSG